MKKRILIISILCFTLLGMPTESFAVNAELMPTEQGIDEDITITLNGQTIVVNGAQGKTLEVVSLTGRMVMAVTIDSPAQRVELNVPKGCYILKIGKVVRKVAIH